MPGEKSKENGRKGGRPKGKVSEATLERMKVLAALNQRIMRNSDVIFDSQMSLIRGSQYLYKIEKEFITTGKNKDGSERGYWKNKKPELVTDSEEMRHYLENITASANGDIEDDQDPSATYYFLTAELPNQSSIDSAYNRVFGKAAQSVDLTSGGEKIQGVVMLPPLKPKE